VARRIAASPGVSYYDSLKEVLPRREDRQRYQEIRARRRERTWPGTGYGQRSMLDLRHHPHPDAAHSVATRIIAAASIRAAAPPWKPIPHRYSFPQQFSPFARWSRAPAASSNENLKPPHRLRLGLGQKLSVRHVSNPNRSSISLDNRRSLFGLEGGERRPLSIYRLACLVGWHNCWNASEGDFVCLECRRSGVHQK
jgi:hypothetical protein